MEEQTKSGIKKIIASFGIGKFFSENKGIKIVLIVIIFILLFQTIALSISLSWFSSWKIESRLVEMGKLEKSKNNYFSGPLTLQKMYFMTMLARMSANNCSLSTDYSGALSDIQSSIDDLDYSGYFSEIQNSLDSLISSVDHLEFTCN